MLVVFVRVSSCIGASMCMCVLWSYNRSNLPGKTTYIIWRLASVNGAMYKSKLEALLTYESKAL